jgi:2,3-bisphosphoglycerate-dependent phosphoglycerate mutase
MKEPKKLVLLRHGKTEFNIEKKFCGWTDIELGKTGEKEAEEAGKLLAENNYTFDIFYTSFLKRAIQTTWIVQQQTDLMWAPLITSWRLNERHYGALQGIKHEEMEKKYGKEQVFLWRRSYKTRPPQLEKTDPRNPANETKYKNLKPTQIPLGESLEDTVKRVTPYWNKEIVPNIKKGKKILISAHGNSIRALVKYIENIPDDEIPKIEIPTAKPIIYELDNNLKPIKKYYL